MVEFDFNFDLYQALDQNGGLELSYLGVYISMSVRFRQFTDKGYEKIMA